jgi:hypothetical protein
MSAFEYHNIERMLTRESELYNKKLYYSACKTDEVVPEPLFRAYKNTIYKTIPGPFKDSPALKKEMDLMAHHHAIDVCELLSTHWGREHERVKLKLNSHLKDWDTNHGKLAQIASPNADHKCFDTAHLQKKALTHMKELEQERKYKLDRNISRESINQSTEAKLPTEVDNIPKKYRVNDTPLGSSVHLNLTTTTATVHNSSQIRNADTGNQTCVVTRNPVNKYPRLSLKKPRVETTVKTSQCKQNINTSCISDNSPNRQSTHESEQRENKTTSTFTLRSRLGQHKINTHDQTKEIHTTENTAKTHNTAHCNIDQNREHGPTINPIPEVNSNDDITDNIDSITLSGENGEDNTQRRQSNNALSRKSTESEDTLNISTQEYTKCFETWTEHEHTCPTKDGSPRKRTFASAFNLNEIGIDNDMIKNAILKVISKKQT